MYIQPGGSINLLGNSLQCPFVAPHATNVLYQDCQEDVIALVIVIPLAVFVAGVAFWFYTRKTDIEVPTDNSSWLAWLKFILIVSMIRVFGYADLMTDISVNFSMLTALDFTDQCTPFNYYERFKHFGYPHKIILVNTPTNPNLTEYMAMLALVPQMDGEPLAVGHEIATETRPGGQEQRSQWHGQQHCLAPKT